MSSQKEIKLKQHLSIAKIGKLRFWLGIVLGIFSAVLFFGFIFSLISSGKFNKKSLIILQYCISKRTDVFSFQYPFPLLLEEISHLKIKAMWSLILTFETDGGLRKYIFSGL